MLAIAIIGMLLFVVGSYSVVKGKIPFIRKYNGVKRISLHSRIEGSAAMLVGTIFVSQYFLAFQSITLVLSILGICVIAFILEIVFKII